jgi:L,D-transpeptidase ErfK/SrfK
MGRIALAGALVGLVGGMISSEPSIPASRQIVGNVMEYTVAPGETLGSIGARLGVDVATMASMNGLRGTKLTAGQALTVDTRHIVPPVPGASIVINVPQRMLFLIDDSASVQAFPVALGRPSWPTPIGPFSILTKEVDPTWDVPVSIQREMQREGKPPLIKVAPGPDNPLGDRWFGLSLPGVGMHGTNAPGSIYHHQTHGCIRLHPDDIRTIFDRVQVGATGEIVYQPVLLAVVEGRVYVESHRDVYRQYPKPVDRLRTSAELLHLADAIDWNRAASVIREQAGIARDVSAARRVTDCGGLPCQ